MHESHAAERGCPADNQIARLRQIAELLRQAHELYEADPPPAPVGILLGADITGAAARTQALINQLLIQQKKEVRRQKSEGRGRGAILSPGY